MVTLLAGCQTADEPTQPPPPRETKVKYSEKYDWEIEDIMRLAKKGDWEEAQAKAASLKEVAPNDSAVDRINAWVIEQGKLQRERALEDSIRSINAKQDTALNPTIPSLLTDEKNSGLPPRKDVRDAVDQIESTPYIPETYGKTIHEPTPLFDLQAATSGKMSKMLEKEVSIHLDGVPLEAVLRNLSETAGVNIVADKSIPALKQVLSINLEKVQLGEFFRYVARNYTLQFQVGADLVWVVDANDPKNLMEETRFYRLRKGFVLPAEFGSEAVTVSKTTQKDVTTTVETQQFKRFVNDQTEPTPAMEKAIKELFTGSKYLIDYERNLIVARGTPEQLKVLEQIIDEFDRPIQQVLIEARFVTISKPAFMQLGVIWESARTPPEERAPTDFTDLVQSGNTRYLGIGISETFTNILDSDTLSATFTALEQLGESQTLSAPRLTVLNNRPATISDGKVQYYYEEYQVLTTTTERTVASSFVPSGKPTKITAGAELDVLASISGDGRSILLALNPRVNTDVRLVTFTTLVQPDAVTGEQTTMDIKLPEYRTQELATRTTVRSGQTVVMGGVLERERSTFVESIPVLGDLPLVGALFRRRTEVDRPRYLLVFVTATIVTDTGEFLVYENETGSAK